MQFKKSAFIVIMLLAACAALIANSGFAKADGIAFTVSPMSSEIKANPGDEQTGTFSIRDDGSVQTGSMRLKVYAMDWTLDENGSPSFSPAGSLPQTCASWVTINPSEVTVSPGQSIDVRYTVHVPADATGTYHTIVMVQPVQTGSMDPSAPHGVAVYGRIGAALYVQVGQQVKRARITLFAVTSNDATVAIQNTGTSELRLTGTLKITDASGTILKAETLPSVLILPSAGAGATASRIIKLSDLGLANIPGQTATVLLDYGSGFLLGARCGVAN